MRAAARTTEEVGERTRADDLLEKFARPEEDPGRRVAARTLKALAGLDMTVTPPPVGGFQLVDPARRTSSLPAETSAAMTPTPVPVRVAPVRVAPVVVSPGGGRKRPLWMALLALLLVGAAGVAYTLRPGFLSASVDPATAATP